MATDLLVFHVEYARRGEGEGGGEGREREREWMEERRGGAVSGGGNLEPGSQSAKAESTHRERGGCARAE